MTITRTELNELAAVIKQERLRALDLDEAGQEVAAQVLDKVSQGVAEVARLANDRFDYDKWYKASDATVYERNEWVERRQAKEARLREANRERLPARFDRMGFPAQDGPVRSVVADFYPGA